MTIAQSEPATPHVPVRGRATRAANYARRHATAAGLLLWAAAGTAYAIHATGTALPDPTRFAMLESWLIGLGCIGCPLLPLRTLARHVRLQAFQAVALVAAALTILLTGLILGGALHYNTLDATFAVILPLAMAIQAVNAADGETHARRREDRARREGRLNALKAMAAQSRSALAGIDRLEGMSIGELEALIDTAETLIKEKRAAAPALQLLPSPPTAAWSRTKPLRAVAGARYAPHGHHHD